MTDLYKLGMKYIKPIAENNKDIFNMFYGKSGKLGEIIFATRVNMKMTQEDLANKLDIKPDDIYRLEGGSIDMGDEFYEKVFDVMGLDYEDYKELYEQR